MSLRWRLQVLLVIVALPLGALVFLHAYGGWHERARAAERAALDEARRLAASVDMLIQGARQAATAFALRVQDEAFDAAACAEYARAIVAAEPGFLAAMVITPAGRPWCASGSGPPVLSRAGREHLDAALATRGLVPGEVTGDPLHARASLPLALAYRDRAGRPQGVVLLTLHLEHLAGQLAARFATDRGFAMVLDRQGSIAARIPGHSLHVAQHVPAEIAGAFAGPGPLVLPRLEHAGGTYIAALVPVETPSGLAAVVGLDRAAALAAARAALLRDVAVAAAVLAFALLAGRQAGRRLIRRPLHALIARAERHASGPVAARGAQAGDRSEFGRLGAALDAMTARVEDLAGQKSVLVRDIHHRVMNSLHLLGAIFHLQSRQTDSEAARRLLDEARERVAAVSVIYRHLFDCAATRVVEFGGVLRRLCDEAAQAGTGAPLTVEVEADFMELPVENAMCLALITHELITNAARHAYGGEGGELRVEFRHDGDVMELAVTDWGKGLPPNFIAERSRTLGMMVIHSLTRQMRGCFAAERRARGTRFVVALPMPGATSPAAGPSREPLVA